jgi:peptidyl-prolyl cis-trans isomerase-like protein 2
LTNILPWIKKHGTNPVNGEALKSSELIKLNFAKNDENEFVDPVTYKVFTDNTHLIAIRNTGNVFAHDTIERLNIKAKNWRDLVSDTEFKRSDLITLQDPQNVESRDLSQFKHLSEGKSVSGTEVSAAADETVSGSAAKVLKAKDAVARARAQREQSSSNSGGSSAQNPALATARRANAEATKSGSAAKAVPYNAAQYTSGQAAASFTSTGLTPSTSTQRVIMSDEEYLLKPRRVKTKGYISVNTNLGSVNIELYPEFAPKAVWNFIQLAKRGYYDGVAFHRNLKNFMIQGGDPTGTGRGGQSCWGKTFVDETEGPLAHDARGILSMANKGKDTNTSQFFILYRASPHLNRKHTIFGKVVEGLPTLDRLEKVPVDEKGKPEATCRIGSMAVLIDPFEDFLKQRSEKEAEEARTEQLRLEGGAEDDRMTWTGKRVRSDGKLDIAPAGSSIGKYLAQATVADDQKQARLSPEGDMAPAAKKLKKAGGGFGDFSGW